MTARTVEGGPATIVLQEHWSETDPDTVRFTECVHCIDPGWRWTRGEIKACIAAAWAELQTYADAGVEALTELFKYKKVESVRIVAPHDTAAGVFAM